MDDKPYQPEVKHERELREQWQDAHERFHAIDKEALILARREVDRRLEEMNQFREQIARERGDFTRRELHDRMAESTDIRLKSLENIKSNLEGRLWMVGAIVSAIVVGVNLLLHYFGK